MTSDIISKSKTNNCERNLSPVILKSNQMVAHKILTNFTFYPNYLFFPYLFNTLKKYFIDQCTIAKAKKIHCMLMCNNCKLWVQVRVNFVFEISCPLKI